MKFQLFICPSRSREMTDADRAAIPAAMEAWYDEAGARRLEGAIFGDGATVSVRDGDVTRSDGPSATAGIAGFNILDCADLDDAVALAAKHPMARFGTVELRPY